MNHVRSKLNGKNGQDWERSCGDTSRAKENVYNVLLYIVISNLEFSSRILENFRENSGKIGKMLLGYAIVKEET